MIDIQILRDGIQAVKAALQFRHCDVDLDEVVRLDEEHRRMITELEALNQHKNQANDEVVMLKRKKSDLSEKIAEMKTVSQKIDKYKAKVAEIGSELTVNLLLIPNLASSDTPQGATAQANRLISESMPRDKRDFKRKTHIELGESLDILDMPRAAKISGSSFVLFKGDGARLERALVNFMLDVHTGEHGYREISPPLLVKRRSMQATGQLPKFEEDMYRIFRGDSVSEDGSAREDDMFLIPTAEVPVTNIHSGEILSEEKLPVAYAAYTPCFRLEAGAYGKETKGMIRVHQFDKVELVRICRPEDSGQEHELLLSHAEAIFKKLGLPYRVVLLAAGDMGFAATKCYDIEVWAPGVNQWLEASSCSNFGDFQARRASIKFKDGASKKTRFTHTLNGSGAALARTFIAVLENYQQADGSVLIPEVLRPYLGGQTHIRP